MAKEKLMKFESRHDVRIRGQTLDCDPEVRDQSIGPEAVLEGCTLLLRKGIGGGEFSILAPTDLIACRVVVEKRLRDYQNWLNARMVRCSFEGHFSSNDFGHWQPNPNWRPDPAMPWLRQTMVYGDVVDCDFTKAKVDMCRFINVDPSQVKLPGWPHVVFLKPHRISRILRNFSNLPTPIKVMLETNAEEDPQVTIAVDHVAAAIKKGHYTEAQLREVLGQLPEGYCMC